ncbi:MAG: hypothetical protein WBB29_10425 [Geitlerinemataceae cyanobacterium]
MATSSQVKQYLAYWFQLGKRAIVRNGQKSVLPDPVIRGDRYSREFEDCWTLMLSPESGDCYLEGTSQTIQQLLSPEWDLADCPRCEMPVPLREMGAQDTGCPCSDLPTWPNLELPTPRSPVNTQQHLNNMRSRIINNDR